MVAVDDTSLTTGCVRSPSGLQPAITAPPMTTTSQQRNPVTNQTAPTSVDNNMPIIIISSIPGALFLIVICILTFFYFRKTGKGSFSDGNGNISGLDNPMYGPSDTPMTDFKMVGPETTPYMAPAEA